jgi:nitrous oxidase accessory protein NosD
LLTQLVCDNLRVSVTTPTAKEFIPLKSTYNLLTIFFLTAMSAWAQCTIIVAPGGSNGNPGTVTAPLATPDFAVAKASAGAVVCLRAGTYQLTTHVVIDKSLTIQSYPGEWAVIAGDNTDASTVGEIIFVAANDVTIQDLEVSGASFYGIHVNSYLLGFPPANTKILRTKVHDSGYTGIKVYQGDNVQIVNSEIYATGTRIGGGSGADILATIPSASNPSGPGATMTGNYIHDAPTSGIVIKAGAVNALIEGNRVERVASGIYNGGDSGGQFFRNGATSECINCTVRNNLVLNTSAVGLACWGAQGAQIVNNTVINAANSIQAAFFAPPDSLGFACTNATVRNNIFVSSSARPMIHLVSPGPGNSFDYNLYYNTSGTYNIWWESASFTAYWNSVAAWQAAVGQDPHSLATQDPTLDSANSYKPLAGSPAIDHGVTLGNVPTDYLGTLRPQGAGFDIGALEFPQGSTAPAPAHLLMISGSGQSAITGTAFGAPLLAEVTDASGNPMAGITVTFTMPGSVASGNFGGSLTASATTGSTGMATSPGITADGSAGTYTANASSGALVPVGYSLTNTAPAPVAPPAPIASRLVGVSGGGQTTRVNSVFSAPLVARVTDASGHGVAGVAVTFAVPGSGASGTFGGALTASTITDANGLATSPLITANGIAGTFTAGALSGQLSTATFSLTNKAESGKTLVPKHILTISGSGQTTQIGSNFGAPLVAKVTDQAGVGIAGLSVTFTLPNGGASGTFSGALTATVITGSNGTAGSPVITANGNGGQYLVFASSGSLNPIPFLLTNTN